MSSNKKVSVYEDDKTILGMYKAKFEKAGYAVFAHENAVDIVSEVKSEKPDIVLVDILMPKVDGHVAIQSLQKGSTTKNIPILVITNFSDDLNIQKALWHGAYDVIIKADTTPKQVVEHVEGALAGKSPKFKKRDEFASVINRGGDIQPTDSK